MATTPLSIGTFSGLVDIANLRASSGVNNPSSAAWPSANLAVYIPFSLKFDYTATKVLWANGATAGGNIDIGVYLASSGAAVNRLGATAQGAANAVVEAAFSVSLTKNVPYYLGVMFSATTGAAFTSSSVTAEVGRYIGMLQEATAGSLPASMTGVKLTGAAAYQLVGLARV